jgi:hypothetical protein
LLVEDLGRRAAEGGAALAEAGLFCGLGRGGRGQVCTQLETKDNDMALNDSTFGSSAWTPRILGSLLCVGVAVIHVIDQHGLSMKEPAYLGIGFYILKIVGVITAILLLSRATGVGWLLAIGVAAGPLAGYILSRGVGLPNATEDVGNWAEPLGVASLVVEGLLLLVSVAIVARGRLSQRELQAQRASGV